MQMELMKRPSQKNIQETPALMSSGQWMNITKTFSLILLVTNKKLQHFLRFSRLVLDSEISRIMLNIRNKLTGNYCFAVVYYTIVFVIVIFFVLFYWHIKYQNVFCYYRSPVIDLSC